MTSHILEADLPEILAEILTGSRPLDEVNQLFEEITGNDIGDFDIRMKDGRLFRAYFQEVVDED